MQDKEKTFGEFLREKRRDKGITLRKYAELSGLSPVYMSYMETNQRAAPRDNKVLAHMAALLVLSKPDEQTFFDLAAESASAPRVSGDLPDYIMGNDVVRIALRTAKDVDATDQEWLEFIEKLRKREQGQGGGRDGL